MSGQVLEILLVCLYARLQFNWLKLIKKIYHYTGGGCQERLCSFHPWRFFSMPLSPGQLGIILKLSPFWAACQTRWLPEISSHLIYWMMLHCVLKSPNPQMALTQLFGFWTAVRYNCKAFTFCFCVHFLTFSFKSCIHGTPSTSWLLRFRTDFNFFLGTYMYKDHGCILFSLNTIHWIQRLVQMDLSEVKLLPSRMQWQPC